MNSETGPGEPFKDVILGEQIRLALQHTPTMQATSAVVAFVLSYVVRDIIPPANALAWDMMILFTVTGSLALYFVFSKTQKKSFGWVRWRTVFLILTLISGVVWGASAFLMFPSDDPRLASLFVLVIASLSAAATASQSSLKWAPAAWAVPAMLLYAGRCIVEGGLFGFTAGFLLIFCLFTVVRFSFEQNTSITSAITTQVANLRLLTELQKANTALRQEITQRKLAEDMVRHSETNLRVILESTADGILAVDDRGKIIKENRRFADLWKLPGPFREADEVAAVFNPVLDQLVDPDLFLKKTRTLCETAELDTDLLFFKDGRVFESFSAPLVREGAVIGRVWSFRDTTERRRAEEALRESEANQKSILRAAPIGIGLVYERVLTQVNERLCEMLGYSHEELVGKNAMILYPSREEFERVGKQRYDQTDVWGTGTVETRWKRKDGTLIDVLLSSAPLDPANRSAGVTFAASDITKRKMAETALSESQERFRELAELLPETIFEMDAGGTLTFVNRNAYEHFGFSKEEFEGGLNGFDMISPEDRPRAMENTQRVMSGERIGLNEYNARRKDGSTFPVIMHSAAKYHDGKPSGIRGIVIDITDKKKFESQLLEAHKMEAIGTLAGGIAHDFNNILQVVQGFAELLLMEKGEGAQHKKLVEICRAANRGRQLTRQLLTFSRKVEPELQPIDLNWTVDEVRTLLERTIHKMIRIELRTMPELRRVYADAAQIEQILMNLAVNARDAMPNGGTLLIETKNVIVDENDYLAHAEVPPGNYVQLAVSDTGHGMDQETREHIFDPFFTTKEIGKGTGLGLAIVYGIVRNHQGHIDCTSTPGEGTTFRIHFPTVERFERTPDSSKGKMALSRGNETVLLVDDDGPVRSVAEQILQKAGYNVLCAATGESALEVYKEMKERIDLVILDLVMPGMGGNDCLLKLFEVNPRVRVVIATGYTAIGEAERAIEFGAKAIISKPFDAGHMLRVVREVLGQGSNSAP